MSDTPNLDKRKAHEKEIFAITQFLEYLEEKDICLCQRSTNEFDDDVSFLRSKTVKEYIDKFYKIDSTKAEEELTKVLDSYRNKMRKTLDKM